MTTKSLRPMAFRFAIGSVLGAALLAGTAYGDARAKSASEDSADQLKRSDEKAVGRAEDAVAKSPSDVALRAALGQAYLRTGRFASATAAFTDALALGDSSPRTALGLALANIARGNSREAIAIIDGAQGGLPASDRGLALALAGDTGRGVAVLSDALRGGDNSPKMRQNLAYAFALNGNWREARIMITQDVPGDELNARLTQWAASGNPEQYHERVATLLGAPVRADTGMPERLALNAAPATVQAAADVPAAPLTAPVAELPPVEQANTFAAAPAPAPGLSTLPETPAEASVAAPAETPSLAAFDEFARPVSTFAAAPEPAPSHRAAPARATHAAFQTSASGNHVVQLGSFSSEQNARRAWTVFVSRNPELKSARMVITPAVVNGRNFWRVAAASFDGSSARGVCSSVKARGGACFAYATSGPRTNFAMTSTAGTARSSVALARR